jgi:hypothetical protein
MIVCPCALLPVYLHVLSSCIDIFLDGQPLTRIIKASPHLALLLCFQYTRRQVFRTADRAIPIHFHRCPLHAHSMMYVDWIWNAMGPKAVSEKLRRMR